MQISRNAVKHVHENQPEPWKAYINHENTLGNNENQPNNVKTIASQKHCQRRLSTNNCIV